MSEQGPDEKKARGLGPYCNLPQMQMFFEDKRGKARALEGHRSSVERRKVCKVATNNDMGIKTEGLNKMERFVCALWV